MAAQYEDALMRIAAFAHLRRLSETLNYLASDDIRAGFAYNGERVPFVNPQRGIFKLQSMHYLFSNRIVFPTAGRYIWSDDQRTVHPQNLIGIDPDYKIHVSARLLNQKDGAKLEGHKLPDKRSIYLSHREKDRPDRVRLEARFLQFQECAA